MSAAASWGSRRPAGASDPTAAGVRLDVRSEARSQLALQRQISGMTRIPGLQRGGGVRGGLQLGQQGRCVGQGGRGSDQARDLQRIDPPAARIPRILGRKQRERRFACFGACRARGLGQFAEPAGVQSVLAGALGQRQKTARPRCRFAILDPGRGIAGGFIEGARTLYERGGQGLQTRQRIQRRIQQGAIHCRDWRGYRRARSDLGRGDLGLRLDQRPARDGRGRGLRQCVLRQIGRGRGLGTIRQHDDAGEGILRLGQNGGPDHGAPGHGRGRLAGDLRHIRAEGRFRTVRNPGLDLRQVRRGDLDAADDRGKLGPVGGDMDLDLRQGIEHRAEPGIQYRLRAHWQRGHRQRCNGNDSCAETHDLSPACGLLTCRWPALG